MVLRAYDPGDDAVRVLCPDRSVCEVLDGETPPPEAFGSDGYPLPPTDEWLRVRRDDGTVRYWPTGLCVRLAKEGR